MSSDIPHIVKRERKLIDQHFVPGELYEIDHKSMISSGHYDMSFFGVSSINDKEKTIYRNNGTGSDLFMELPRFTFEYIKKEPNYMLLVKSLYDYGEVTNIGDAKNFISHPGSAYLPVLVFMFPDGSLKLDTLTFSLKRVAFKRITL